MTRDLTFLAYAVSANLAVLLFAGWFLAVLHEGWAQVVWLVATPCILHWVNHRWVYPLA